MIRRWAAAALVLACGSGALAQEAAVTGTAFVGERLAPPPDAVFEAVLEDVGRDGPPVTIGRFASGPTPAAATPFAIPYDPARIDPAGRYAVRARILKDGRPLFVTDAPAPVLTRGAPSSVALALRRFGAAPGAAAAPPPGPRRAMRGLYRETGEAGRFADCASGMLLAVAAEGAAAALARAYAAAPRAPGGDVLVELDGRVAERPGPDGWQPTLVVERLRGAWPGESCGAPGPAAPLRGTYWRLTRLGERAVVPAGDRRAPHLVFAAHDDRIGGAGGCNPFAGTFRADASAIAIGPAAVTRMACAAGMDTERAFLAALAAARRWRIAGQHLELQDAAGRQVARFEAGPAR